MDDDDSAAILEAFPDLIPEGSVLAHGIIVLEVLDPSGEQQTFYHMIGEPYDTQTVGLLEWAKLDIYRMSEEGEEDAEG